MLIFPEGTRSASGEPGDPKGGTGMLACRMALKVVPVRVFGAFDILPRGRGVLSASLAHCAISVVFGKPLTPADFDPGKANPDRYLEATRRIMATIAGLPELESAIACFERFERTRWATDQAFFPAFAAFLRSLISASVSLLSCTSLLRMRARSLGSMRSMKSTP